MKGINLFIILVAISFAQCKSKQPTGNGSDENSGKASLAGTFWVLSEIHGKAYQPTDADAKKIYFQLNESEHRVSASGGCNGIGGNYETKEPNRIKFSELISTMMACPELEWENEFKDVLNNADSYYINADTLQLNRARMAPLAIFIAQDSNPNN